MKGCACVQVMADVFFDTLAIKIHLKGDFRTFNRNAVKSVQRNHSREENARLKGVIRHFDKGKSRCTLASSFHNIVIHIQIKSSFIVPKMGENPLHI